jgi:hypothetical protein
MAVAWSDSHYPLGLYTIRWDGRGRIGFARGRGVIRSSEPNRLVVEVTGNDAPLYVAIEETQAADPVRNLRVLWPGTEPDRAGHPFNPAFLAKLAPFSLLRFMDWGGTNGSSLVEWADRRLQDELRWTTTKGVPMEVMVALANLLRADPWFCVPHQASDDYVHRLANFLKDHLDPSLRPHVEYSNEVWNRLFPQFQWASAQSERLGLPRPSGMPSRRGDARHDDRAVARADADRPARQGVRRDARQRAARAQARPVAAGLRRRRPRYERALRG